MNFKTTVVLLVLAAAGGALLWFGPALPAWVGVTAPAAAPRSSVALGVLENDLTADKLTKIDVKRGDRPVVSLERGADGEWSLPGKWPARKAESEGLVKLLGGLHSRFEAERPKGEPPDLAPFGLDKPALTVTVRAGDKEHRLEFGDDAGDESRFARPTWLRIDGGGEVVRLAPGLIASIDKPGDYYQQRRLFPAERVAKEPGSAEKVEQLAAQAVSADDAQAGVSWTLTRGPEEWDVTRPVRDRADPDKLRTLLAGVPDVWAEQFVARPYKPLAEYGLEPPEETLSVTRPGGTVTLLIGKTSPTVRERKVTRPPPPGMPPGMPPLTETIKEEFRYAKLKDNEQVFEVKADRVKELFVNVKELRDARLARFKPDDARRLEIKYAGQDVVLVKDKERWQVEKPIKADAEPGKVTEVLSKLSDLQARDADVLDKADPKAQGFDDPAKVGAIAVTVEEEKGEGDGKTKKTRVLTFALGKHDAAAKKLAVKVEGWERVNLVDDALVALAKRPALAYRGRRVLDFVSGDIDAVKVERGGETVTLKSVKDGWKLETPVVADADAVKAGGLASTLSGLEATEFVNDAPKPEDLDADGLAKGALKATVTFTADSKKPPQTLLVGKARADKPNEYYAKLEGGPSVFSVKKEVRDALDQGSLAYRPQQLWQVPPDEVTALRVRQAGQEEYRLTKKDNAWNVAGPFDATAVAPLVEPMLNELAGPRAERYETHDAKAKGLKEYGLDAPHLTLTVATKAKKDGDDKKDKPAPKEDVKERTLLVGKPADKDGKTRYAKLGDGDAVFVVGDKLLAAADKPALDLLDRKLLSVDEKTVEKVQGKGASGALTLQRKGDDWQVVESPVPAPFPADRATVDGLLRTWADLQALRFAAYGPKAEPAKYGLDGPAATVTITVQPPEKDGKKPAPLTHTLALGKPVEGSAGDRYARLDNGPGVAVLPSFVANELMKTHLDFVNRGLVKADAGAVTALKREAGGQSLEVRKKDDGWQIVKPKESRADDATLDRLVEQLTSLRAKKVAAYPAKDAKPFGLDAPAATLTLDGPKPVTVKVGRPVDGATGDDADRYVQVAGSDVVGVLAGALAKQLVADPIKFRDRNVARFDDADRAVLERGPRTATFAKVDGTWKLVAPLEAEAEQAELDDFVNAFARLRADELVADKPADLKPYGLDKPEAKWRFQLGPVDKLTLLVGAREKGGARAYAKVEGRDLVFLLDPQATNRVLGEYRKRAVWASSPDPSQVEALRYGYAGGAFTLEKVNNVWHVAGKPEVKVSAAAVTDALAALDKLRVERFVLDKGADLKQYRLDPPDLVLEVQTPSGKKELHVGRTEGDSKRYYARVPEKDRTDVFLLSEADGSRVVRDLAAFSEKGTKPAKP